jgi:D-lactate dehydrogenase
MSDAVSASLVDGTPNDLKADLIALLGKENVFHRAIDLVRYASDASPYRLIPQVVVLPQTTDDIIKLFRYCRDTGRHATFRAAGTSLNGQSLSDDILIDVRRHWNGGKVESDGARVRVRPGMILSHINAMLEPYSRRVGPDPASSASCTIGGVIANNAGGMRCTVPKDAYHTHDLSSVVVDIRIFRKRVSDGIEIEHIHRLDILGDYPPISKWPPGDLAENVNRDVSSVKSPHG